MRLTMNIAKMLLISLALLFVFISCDDDDPIVEITVPIDLLDDVYDNIPVVVNTENSFTFTVAANQLDYTYDNNINFNKDTLVVTITLTNASSNNSSVQILDSENNFVFNESLNESKVLVNTELINLDSKRVKLELQDFSGQLTFVIAPKNP